MATSVGKDSFFLMRYIKLIGLDVKHIWSGEETFKKVFLVWGIGLWHVMLAFMSVSFRYLIDIDYSGEVNEFVVFLYFSIPALPGILIGRWLYCRVKFKYIAIRRLIMTAYTVLILPLLPFSIMGLIIITVLINHQTVAYEYSYFELYKTLYGWMF